MTSGMRILLSLAVLVLIAGLPLASSNAPAAQPAPAVAAAEPFVPVAAELFGPPATQACPRTDIPSFFAEPKAALVEGCGTCSDAGCLGKGPTSPCGGGRHCVPESQCSSPGFFCRCLAS